MHTSILSQLISSFRSLSSGWRIFLVGALITGALLRTLYGTDIEYKYDEHFMFERTQNVGITEPLPWIGMPSGVGTVNPGMSIWVFLGLSRLFHAENPPELARAVEILNILALILLTLFSLGVVERGERSPWLWAVALAAVNPLAVLLERKIWAQSTLPIFCVLLLWGWWKRDSRGGAFLMGLVGILVGQIHMSGFIFMTALLAWTFLFSKRLNPARSIHLGGLVSGGLIGFPFLVPWLSYLIDHSGSSTPWSAHIFNWDHKPFLSSVFWQLWVTDPSGLGIWYSLGSQEFLDFLKYPFVADTPTYLIGLAHLVLLCVLFSLFYRILKSLSSRSDSGSELFAGLKSNSDFLRNSALWGYGILMTVLGFTLYRHYLLITFPLGFLWLSQLILRHMKFPERVLGLVWICQLTLSLGFLHYIHVNHGAATGDYGIGYQFQNKSPGGSGGS